MCTLNHLHLFCSDLERMRSFWVNALHARFIGYRKFGDNPGAVLQSGNLNVYLKEVSNAQPANNNTLGFNHVGFAVKNVQEEADRLIRDFDCTLYAAPQGKPFLFLQGPENLIIELEPVENK